jgi:oxygen-independent coproporphyrinogen-3 oxidase
LAGIYIHIPFCKKACHYCDFHFSTTLKEQPRMVEALKKELGLRADELSGDEINTIYFGGGTPSLLSKSELISILDFVQRTYKVADNPEVTLEANPDDLTDVVLQNIKDAGFNRLSIGVQSFYDEHLNWMNRAHNTKESLACIQKAQEIGITNITIDLIYGFPALTDEQWKSNVQQAIDLNVPHISAYNLTIEEGTALFHQVKKGISKPLSDEQGANNLNYLIKELSKSGLIQYEISNFGKEGFFSEHNSNYWKREKYMGIGPSAHSFSVDTRSWNVANNQVYMQKVESGELPKTSELLSEKDRANEHLMIGLRNIWGCNWDYLRSVLTPRQQEKLKSKAQKWFGQRKIINNGNGFKTTPKGLLFADAIAEDLFVI